MQSKAELSSSMVLGEDETWAGGGRGGGGGGGAHQAMSTVWCVNQTADTPSEEHHSTAE